MKPNVGLGAVRDIGTLAHQAGLGHVLEPAELLDVQATLAHGHTVRETIDRLRVYLPFLAEVSDRIADFREITSEIGRCINQRAEVVDSASPVLAQLRRESRVAHDSLTARLNQLLTSSRTAIQEPIVTLRDGRYVIPVKAEQRAQLPGIVHDVSSSGATVFLEPLETVEMGNRWREMLAEEQRELARILRELSSRVGARDADIAETIEALAKIDLSLAKARLGEEIGAKELPYDGHEQPWLREKPDALFLENARHPLLTGEVVPVTVWLGDALENRNSKVESDRGAFTVLLITGPNTGGKTVALKTVGLLSLMAQAGLPLPAGANSRLPIFDAVYADIGDEQSIEQSLSTFRSHVGNIISILESATGGSIVLLDELGAGTDPVEGAALAKAILSHLLAIGCLTVATTHHGEMETELAQMRSRLRDATRELQKAERLNVFERAQAVEAAKEEVAEAETSVKRVTTRTPRRRRAPLPQIAAGDQVFLIDVPTPGEAISPPDEQGDLDVKLGSLRARINVRQIERVEKGERGNGDGRGAAPPASRLPMPTIPPELDLRGLTVDEALLLIDQRLDEAARAGVRELRIIHGKGTGTLRRAVREMLSKHALVQGHAAAQPRGGGDGVTVVELAG